MPTSDSYRDFPKELCCQLPRFLEGQLHCLHSRLGLVMLSPVDLVSQQNTKYVDEFDDQPSKTIDQNHGSTNRLFSLYVL